MNIKLKIKPNYETRTSLELSIGEFKFDLKDRELEDLLIQANDLRPDLFNRCNYMENKVLESKISNLEQENSDLNDKISELEDELDNYDLN